VAVIANQNCGTGEALSQSKPGRGLPSRPKCPTFSNRRGSTSRPFDRARGRGKRNALAADQTSEFPRSAIGPCFAQQHHRRTESVELVCLTWASRPSSSLHARFAA
jgi:hypothetical protein